MSDPSELNKAIKNHSVWKVRLKDAVDTGKSEFTPSQVRDNNMCAFGQWLNSLPLSEKSLEEYKNISALHAEFHATAAKVLQMALDGRKEEAHTALTDIRGDFMYTSAKLTNALMDWKTKLSLAGR